MRLLQLWLTLPKSQRWTEPGFQDIHADSIPVRDANGVEVRLYSGASGDQHSSTRNRVPVTLAEITLAGGASFEQDLPASYNGFVPLSGSSATYETVIVYSPFIFGHARRPSRRRDASDQLALALDGHFPAGVAERSDRVPPCGMGIAQPGIGITSDSSFRSRALR